MTKNRRNLLVLCFGIFLTVSATAQPGNNGREYRTAEEVIQQLRKLEQSHPDQIKLHTIASSPGGDPVIIAEVGHKQKDVPAIFTAANFEGNVPLATEGALELISMLQDSVKYLEGLRWFILPLPNPDASRAYFSKVRYERLVNDFEVNNDMDEAVNEDGPDDLNGDGLITQMRVKDPEGTYRISQTDPRLMARADKDKGERGEYRIYPEGLDNDGDGKYNEDGAGGINPGISFPHLFSYDNRESGLFPGQSPGVYAIMRFVYDHPEIAMAFTLGSSDFCRTPPRGNRKGGVNLQSFKIPARFVRMFDVDPNQTFTMDQVIEMMKERFPAGTEVTPTMVAGFLGLGAAVNPLEEDLKIYTRLSEAYKKFLEDRNAGAERLGAPADKDGSFELWAYYHLGIPSFSMNLFTVPAIKKDKNDTTGVPGFAEIEKMSSDRFLALGEEKIGAFLKSVNAPERFTAKEVMGMISSGKITPVQLVPMVKAQSGSGKTGGSADREKALLAWSEKAWNGKGFVDWQKYRHPQLGEVEIGGFAPYLETTPPAACADSLINAQLPWLLKLADNLPEISFAGEKITSLGGGIYRLEMYIENKGELPWPIAMGERNRQPAPVIILLEGNMELLEGLKRTPLGTIMNNQVKKLTWLIKTDKNDTITAIIESKVFGTSKKEIRVGG